MARLPDHLRTLLPPPEKWERDYARMDWHYCGECAGSYPAGAPKFLLGGWVPIKRLTCMGNHQRQEPCGRHFRSLAAGARHAAKQGHGSGFAIEELTGHNYEVDAFVPGPESAVVGRQYVINEAPELADLLVEAGLLRGPS